MLNDQIDNLTTKQISKLRSSQEFPSSLICDSVIAQEEADKVEEDNEYLEDDSVILSDDSDYE